MKARSFCGKVLIILVTVFLNPDTTGRSDRFNREPYLYPIWWHKKPGVALAWCEPVRIGQNRWPGQSRYPAVHAFLCWLLRFSSSGFYFFCLSLVAVGRRFQVTAITFDSYLPALVAVDFLCWFLPSLLFSGDCQPVVQGDEISSWWDDIVTGEDER